MNKPIFSVLLAALLTLHVQAQIPPPDFYGDTINPGYSVWENTGWVADTYGELHPEIKYVTEGATPRAYFWNSCQIAFVLASVDADTTTLDTLRRIDLKFTGEQFQAPEPQVSKEVSYTKNFYLPHCPDGAVDVHGYKKLLYEDIYPNIDLWVYSGALGQKMAFVIKPGASPADIQMQFFGQDDMDVDVMGNLKLLLADKWIELRQAVAYQYDEYDDIIPVNWTAQYLEDENSGIVGFAFDDYDTEQPLVLLLGPPPPMGAGGPPWDEPGLCWSTYYGGDGVDRIFDSTKDSGGGFYICGETYSSSNTFPSEGGVNTIGLAASSLITKFNTADHISWQTFVGGLPNEMVRAGSCAIQSLPLTQWLVVGGYCFTHDLPIHNNGVAHIDSSFAEGWLGGFELQLGHRLWLTYLAGKGVDAVGAASDRLFFASRITTPTLAVDTTPAPSGSTFWLNATPATVDGVVGMLDGQDRLWWFTYIPTPTGCVGCPITGISTGGMDVRNGKVIVSFATGDPATQMVGMAPYEGMASDSGATDLAIYEFDLNGTALWSTFHGGNWSEVGSVDGQCYNTVAIDPTTGDFVVTGVGYHSIDLSWPNVGWNDQVFNASGAQNTTFVTRFDGSTHLKEWGSYLDGTEEASQWACCAFGSDGTLYIGGQRMGNTLDLVPGNGYYFQDQIMLNEGSSPNDGFLMAIAPNFSLSWSTLIGGVGGSNEECVTTILERFFDGSIYVAGMTTKAIGNQGSYFPLDDGGGGPWFSGTYFGGYTDGFIARLCSEIGTSIEPSPHVDRTFDAWMSAPDQLTVQLASTGQEAFSIFGLDGRLVQAGTLRPALGTTSAFFPVSALAPGCYVLHCPAGSARFIKP